MAPLSFVKDISQDGNYIIKLITSVNPEGEFFYAYLLMNHEHSGILEAALRTRQVALEDYGTILASGLGLEPEPEVKREIETKFIASPAEQQVEPA